MAHVSLSQDTPSVLLLIFGVSSPVGTQQPTLAAQTCPSVCRQLSSSSALATASCTSRHLCIESLLWTGSETLCGSAIGCHCVHRRPLALPLTCSILAATAALSQPACSFEPHLAACPSALRRSLSTLHISIDHQLFAASRSTEVGCGFLLSHLPVLISLLLCISA